ncbi:amidohydrolase family protein [Hydrogenophaga sp. BPS33]|uniref:amidohydrolase family protein n=1 Tax=Hydrogenophaga sp. BPS33 TaxID=2651974 RepID=UPI00131FA23E|nr:amidohydrolase family protein [Hydrogenophaga sp. BPS33]QHE89314.1 amidohydrolase family protein [Hydrogenophaga sp. BPS33]
MIIDFRVRPPLGSFTKLSIYTNKWLKGLFAFHGEAPRSAQSESMELFREELQRAGVVKTVVWGRAVSDPAESTSNDDVAAIVAAHPDTFAAGLGGIFVRDNSQAAIDEAVKAVDHAITTLGMRGITLEPTFDQHGLAHPNDERFYPVYQRCAELGGILGLTVSRGSGKDQDLSHSNPVHVDRVARSFPTLPIVVSHAFWPFVEESCGLAFRRDNVYLVPDMYGVGMPGHLGWVELANTVSPEKILFASAYPIVGVEELVAGYLRLPFRNDTIRDMVMGGNAARLLGISL